MLSTAGILFLAGMAVGANEIPTKSEIPTQFDNYTQAYRTAQEVHLPILVILNPGKGSVETPISLASVERTQKRRELLENYIVVVIDVETEHGKKVHKLFDDQPLPYVSVIDKDQKFQIFRTSEALYGEYWNRILESFQTGEQTARLISDQYCPT